MMMNADDASNNCPQNLDTFQFQAVFTDCGNI